jgi:hypothetical protein
MQVSVPGPTGRTGRSGPVFTTLKKTNSWVKLPFFSHPSKYSMRFPLVVLGEADFWNNWALGLGRAFCYLHQQTYCLHHMLYLV